MLCRQGQQSHGRQDCQRERGEKEEGGGDAAEAQGGTGGLLTRGKEAERDNQEGDSKEGV